MNKLIGCAVCSFTGYARLPKLQLLFVLKVGLHTDQGHDKTGCHCELLHMLHQAH